MFLQTHLGCFKDIATAGRTRSVPVSCTLWALQPCVHLCQNSWSSLETLALVWILFLTVKYRISLIIIPQCSSLCSTQFSINAVTSYCRPQAIWPPVPIFACLFLSANIGSLLNFSWVYLFILKGHFAILGCYNLANTLFIFISFPSSHISPSWFPHLDLVLSAFVFLEWRASTILLVIPYHPLNSLSWTFFCVFCISLILTTKLQVQILKAYIFLLYLHNDQLNFSYYQHFWLKYLKTRWVGPSPRFSLSLFLSSSYQSGHRYFLACCLCFFSLGKYLWSPFFIKTVS